MKRITLVLILILVLSSMASAKYATYSLQAQIDTTDRQKVKDALVLVMTGRGYLINKDSDYQMAFEKEVENFFFMNLRTGQFPASRVIFTIVPSSGSILLSASPFAVSNPGTGFEMLTKITHRVDLRSCQEMIFKVKSQADGTPLHDLMATLPKIGSGDSKFPQEKEVENQIKSGIKAITPEGYISGIGKGSLAEVAGLHDGDLIFEINGRPADLKDAKKLLSDIDSRIDAGRTVIILFERNREQDMVTLKKP